MGQGWGGTHSEEGLTSDDRQLELSIRPVGEGDPIRQGALILPCIELGPDEARIVE